MDTPLLASLKSGFDALPPALVEAAALGESRRAALAAALADGLPGPRAERWKYTSLRAFQRRRFALAQPAPAVDPATIADIPAPRVVFVNGVFDAALSRLDGLPDGVSLRPLSSALLSGDGREVNFLARRFDGPDEVFARLNAALATDGALLRAEPDVRCDAPIHLVFLGAKTDTDQAWHLRHLIELREGAALRVVEHHRALDAHAHLGNALAHVHLKPGASLLHARVQDEADGASLFARTDAVLAAGSAYRRLDLELGAALSRHELNVALQGEGAALHSGGVLLAAGKRHLDTRLGIDHIAGNTACDLLWRGIGAGRGRAAFHGGILIREGADGTSAELSNKNLLLSEEAEIDTQPVLEIHADEVKAAHGATVGRLDPTALFYLRSRGLPETEARRLLTAAFCRQTLSVLDDEALSGTLATALDARLAMLEA